MTDLISRADALAACQKIADEAKAYGIPQMTMGANTCRDAIRALPAAQVAMPAAQVGVKPLEWVPQNTFAASSIRFDAESVLGNFSMEYGGWANGKLCLSVPWQDASIWLENDPDAAKAYVHEQVSARIRAALIGGEV